MLCQLRLLILEVTGVSVLWEKGLGAVREEGKGMFRQRGIWGDVCPCKEVVEPRGPLSPASEAVLVSPGWPGPYWPYLLFPASQEPIPEGLCLGSASLYQGTPLGAASAPQ